MSEQEQGPQLPEHGQRQRELWAAVKRFLHAHPDASQTDAFSHVAEQYGRTVSGVGSAYYRIERGERGEDDDDEPEPVRRNNRGPNPYRATLQALRRQLAIIERAAQAVGENLDDLERAIAEGMAEREVERARLAELETVLSRLTSLLPGGSET